MKVPDFPRAFARATSDAVQSKQGAQALARRIETAWRACGHEVRCYVQAIRNPDGRIVAYQVKSDLKNGLPTRPTTAAAVPPESPFADPTAE